MWGVLRSSGPDYRSWGVLRSSDLEDRRTPPSSKNPPHFQRSRTLLSPSSVRSSTHFSGPKIEDEEFFDLRRRRSKIEDVGGSSIFGSENRKWGVFDLRSRKIEEPPHFRSSEPEVRRTSHLQSSIFDPENRRTLPSSFFDPEDRRTPPHLRSSEPKLGSKIAIGPVVLHRFPDMPCMKRVYNDN